MKIVVKLSHWMPITSYYTITYYMYVHDKNLRKVNAMYVPQNH